MARSVDNAWTPDATRRLAGTFEEWHGCGFRLFQLRCQDRDADVTFVETVGKAFADPVAISCGLFGKDSRLLQPDALSGVVVDVQLGIRLTCETTAKSVTATGACERVHGRFLREIEVEGIAEERMGQGPQEHTACAAIAPTRHRDGAWFRLNGPACAVSAVSGESGELMESRFHNRRRARSSQPRPTQAGIEQTGPTVGYAEVDDGTA